MYQLLSSFLQPAKTAWGTYYRGDKIPWTFDSPSRKVIIGGEQVIDRQETSGRGVRGICRVVVVERTFGHGAWWSVWRGLTRQERGEVALSHRRPAPSTRSTEYSVQTSSYCPAYIIRFVPCSPSILEVQPSRSPSQPLSLSPPVIHLSCSTPPSHSGDHCYSAVTATKI